MGPLGMKDNDLIETIRSLLRSDDMNQRNAPGYADSDGTSSPVDEFSGEWVDGFPVPAERDGELRDVLIELNVTTHEYIRMALEHHGGRLRQQEIADLTGWSEATVSQKLGEMEDDGHITRFRTGREKIVCLPDDSPIEATQQSVDDDASSDPDSTSGTPSSAPVNRDSSPGEHESRPGEQDAAPPQQDSTPGNPDPPSQ